MASPPPSPYPSSLPASQLRSQPVNPKVDQLIHHFYTKAASIIVQSRVSHVDAQASHRRPSSSHSSHHLGRKIDKWFNLETEDTDLFREELKTWRSPTATMASVEPVPAMVLDILLDVSELDPTQATVLYDSLGSRHRVDTASRNILLERWALTLLPAPPAAPPELPALYKQGIILFRALYALIRALPVYQLSKRLRKRKGGTGTGLRIGCRMSTGLNDGLSSDEDDARPSNRPPREFNLDERLVEDAVVETAAQHFVFAPIHTPIGSLFLECRYRAQADFGVEDKEALLSSRFLNEDFFRPSLRLRVGSQPPTSLHHSPADKLAPSYGSLSSRHSAGPVPFAQASRLSTSPAGTASDESQRESTSRDPRDSGEGAFMTAGSISRPPRSSASPIPHQASPRPPPRMASSPQPIGGSQRFSGSSGFGPSSSLRYTSFSKYGSSPFETSGSAPRPMPNPVQRYSSSKYARSYSSTGSSGGNELASSPAFGPESLGRRSRLGSFTSSSLKEGAPSSATSFSSRLPPGTSSAEVDEINSFLEMIDSRPQLTSIANGARSTYLSRSQADSKLRALADSLSALPSGMQPSTSASNSTRLRSQPIEEEEDYESSAAGLAGVREEAEPVDDSVRQRAEAQPSSYPRYEQTRRPLVQTGFFFPHSASSSPKATAVSSSSAEAPKAPTPPSANKPVFPRYISKSRSQPEHDALTVEERQARRTSYSGVEEETMGHLELSLTASRPEESAAPPEPPSWPHVQPEHPPWRGRDSSLPPFARGRQRPSVALYERQRGGARSDKLKDSSSSASSG